MKVVNDKLLQEKIGFTPHVAQQQILDEMKRFTIIDAGRRFGKSKLCSYLALRELMAKKRKIWVVAPCVDTETEALTKKGWVKYNELTINDQLLTLNKNGEAEWQKCQKVSTFDYDDYLIEIDLKSHSSLTTPHHRWLVGYEGRDTKTGRSKTLGYRFTETRNMIKSNEYILGGAPVLNLPKVKKYKDSFIELIGWYWTEGGANGNGCNISQNEGKNADRIRKAALNYFGEPKEVGVRSDRNKPAWFDWRRQGKGFKNGDFYFNPKATEIFKKIAPNKIIKIGFINSLTLDQLNLLIDVLIMADGHKRTMIADKDKHLYDERVIFQKKKERLDSLQIVAQLAGYESRIRLEAEDKYALTIFERRRHWLGQKPQLAKRKNIKYKGIVWCPTTLNGTWLARRKGTVYFTGNTYDLSKKVFAPLNEWIGTYFPSSFKIIHAPYPIIQSPTGSILEGKSCDNIQSLLGEELDLLILDEAAVMPMSIWQQYLYPTLAMRKGRALIISTPRGQNWFYYQYLKGQKKDLLYKSFRFESRDNPYLPKSEWDEAERILPRDIFSQEWKAEFLSDATSVFRGIDRCITGELELAKKGHIYVAGVDLGKHQDYTVIVVCDMLTNHVVYFDRFNQVSWPLVRERIGSAAETYNSALISLDSSGLGDPVSDELTNMGFAVNDFVYGNKSKNQMIIKLSNFIEQKKVIFPQIEDLIHELKIFGYTRTKTGRYQYSAPEGDHDDCVNALGLAVWELEEPLGDIPAQIFSFPEVTY